MDQILNQTSLYDTSTAGLHKASARILDISWSHPVALAPQESLEIIEDPTILRIPGLQYYVDGMIQWQGRWVPAINLVSLMSGGAQDVTYAYALVIVYRYPDSSDLHYGAILFNAISTVHDVTDAESSALPDSSLMLPMISASCFMNGGKHVPILDLQSIFCYRYDWSDKA